MFGFTEGDAWGQSLDLLIPPRQQQRHGDGYHQILKTGVTKYGDDWLRVPALPNDGHVLSIAFTASLLLGADGSVSGIATVIRNEAVRFAHERDSRKQLAALQTQVTALTSGAGSAA